MDEDSNESKMANMTLMEDKCHSNCNEKIHDSQELVERTLKRNARNKAIYTLHKDSLVDRSNWPASSHEDVN